ncbi:MAG: ferritin-like domain-containing protein [Pyrinomonadaceae bacterium]|nr:ferritin-like domain-containing protein [Pyrinomonadaceae bacterium]
MAIKTLEDKFQHELGDIYDAEHQFLEMQQQVLPKVSSPQVTRLLEQHIKQTEQQITVLEQAFAALGVEAKRVKCQGATGIVTENKKTLKDVSSDPMLVDLAIAGGSAKVEHYEISVYRGLVAGAEAMGQTKVMKLLQRNLAQEEQTAAKIEQSIPKLLQQAVKNAGSATSGKKATSAKGRTSAKGVSNTSNSTTDAASQTDEVESAMVATTGQA